MFGWKKCSIYGNTVLVVPGNKNKKIFQLEMLDVDVITTIPLSVF